MSQDTDSESDFFDQPNWFCLRTKPKCEHLAAASLRQLPDVDVYCPRVRFPRATARGAVNFVEALFPCYVFAHFVPAEKLRAAVSAKGVTKPVQFGEHPSVIPGEVIEAIRGEMQGEEIREVRVDPLPGDEVEVTEGAFRGIEGLVTRVTKGSERVHILMEILGQLHEVEVAKRRLKLPRDERGWAAA